jgi:hypothetical protein
MRAQFDKGELTGNVPFGWDCLYTFVDGTTHVSSRALSPGELADRQPESKTLVDNPAEQNTIRLMVSLRKKGLALNKIAQYLNGQGLNTKLGRP